MAKEEEKRKMQAEFEEWLAINYKTSSTNLTKNNYDRLVAEILTARGKRSTKTEREKLLLQTYDVRIGKGTCELISKAKHSKGLVYICSDKLFSVVDSMHVSLGHARPERLLSVLKKKYKNISYKQIQKYISLCRNCQLQKGINGKEKTEVASGSKSNIIRGQVDVIEYGNDNGYKYILIYQDIKTKFVVLKALKSNVSEVVADKLIDIFSIIGAPMVLQSNSDEKYLKTILVLLKTIWPALNILYVPKHNDFTNCDEHVQEIENLLLSSMMNSKSTSWKKALRFVQFVKNSELNLDIGKTPYEAYFGMPPRLGLFPTDLPEEAVKNMQSEKDLRKFLENREQLMQTKVTTIPVVINVPQANPQPEIGPQKGVEEIKVENHKLEEGEEKEKEEMGKKEKKNELKFKEIDMNGLEDDDLDGNIDNATKRQHEIIESLEEDLDDCLSSNLTDFFKVDTAKRKSNTLSSSVKKSKAENR